MVLNIFIQYTAESKIWHISAWESHYIFHHIFSYEIIFYQSHPCFLKWEKSYTKMKIRSNAFLAIAFTITLLDAAKKHKQPTVMGSLDDVAICTSTAKTFEQIFSSRIGAFICWYVDCSACGLHRTRLKRKNNKKKKNCVLCLRK